MILLDSHLSVGTLFRVFWGKISLTWGLTLIETALFAVLPLLIGYSIDGLLEDDWGAFNQLLMALAALVLIATARRIYDTRAYGTMRVELGHALAERSADQPVSVVNARVLMGRELVDFLEGEAPGSLTALIQVIVSILVLLSFHETLALSSGVAALTTLVVYSLFSKRFFRVNSGLNEQSEQQVGELESRDISRIRNHFVLLRKQEVRMSDTESVVYGIIFFLLLTMLSFNLWFAATQSSATTGEIFAIVTYSFEFVQASVILPLALQSMTRLKEITSRINKIAS